ncbi:MAG: hypothetical protein M3N08_09800 [Pseudomonadota bacterium]|nr:hypothetical protein [Pseudomonadota bacterium]
MAMQSLNLSCAPAHTPMSAEIRQRWKEAGAYAAGNRKKIAIYGFLGGALAFDLAFGTYNVAHGIANSIAHATPDLDHLTAGGAGFLGAYKCLVGASITRHACDEGNGRPAGNSAQTMWQKARGAICSPGAHDFLLKTAPYMAPVFAAITVMNLSHGHNYFALMNTGNTYLYANARTVAKVASRFLSHHLG